jgi:periplasmic protein TonB
MADAAMTSPPPADPGRPPRLAPEPAYQPPLTPFRRGAIAALVVFFHVGGGWALTLIEPARLVVGDQTSVEVRMVPAEQPETKVDIPTPEDTPPPEPEPVKLDTPPPDDTPPPEVPMLETMVAPPMPDLPPPEFPVAAKPPPPPPKPKPPPPRPRAQPAAPVDNAPQSAPPSVPQAPRTVSIGQVAYINPPNAIYPARSRRAGEQGRVIMRVLVDTTGRPAQVSVQQSSGHPALDEAAVSAVRASLLRPYSENGVAQAVWVLMPIDFVLR